MEHAAGARPIERVFENAQFIVVDKPAGLLTVPGRNRPANEDTVLGLRLQAEAGRRLFPVHRLDEPVSGLVMFALDAAAHARASQWFEHRLVRKTYRAWTHRRDFSHLPVHSAVHDSFEFGIEREWHVRIQRGKRRSYASAAGKEAVTIARCLGPVAGTDWLAWDLEPRTGRPHQLRVELSRRGFPVVGDRLYGSGIELPGGRIALKAWRLDFAQIETAQRFGLPEFIELSPAPVDDAAPGVV